MFLLKFWIHGYNGTKTGLNSKSIINETKKNPRLKFFRTKGHCVNKKDNHVLKQDPIMYTEVVELNNLGDSIIIIYIYVLTNHLQVSRDL